jgi:hypothetical protein
MKAPYLTIGGRPISKGNSYWTVDVQTGRITQEVAKDENNVTYLCYFESEEDAKMYSEARILGNSLNTFLAKTESKRRGH